jgi:polysaccharide export outer membrane protein
MTSSRHILWVLALALTGGIALHALAQENPVQSLAAGQIAPRTQKSDVKFDDRMPRYRLEEGDTFAVHFEFSPEFDQEITVQPDGFVTLRGVGDVHVAGQTVPQLTTTLNSAYEKTLFQPVISIVLKDFEKPYFVAGGQVGHPGKYTLRGDTTLTQAIQMAGGFTEKSKHSQVLLFRRVSDTWAEARVVDIKKMLSDKNLAEDPFLRTGDMLFVPQNRISKFSRYIPISGLSSYMSPSQF